MPRYARICASPPALPRGGSTACRPSGLERPVKASGLAPGGSTGIASASWREAAHACACEPTGPAPGWFDRLTPVWLVRTPGLAPGWFHRHCKRLPEGGRARACLRTPRPCPGLIRPCVALSGLERPRGVSTGNVSIHSPAACNSLTCEVQLSGNTSHHPSSSITPGRGRRGARKLRGLWRGGLKGYDSVVMT